MMAREASIGGERRGEVALARSTLPIFPAGAHVTLPFGISGVGLGEAFEDGKGGLIGSERSGEVALELGARRRYCHARWTGRAAIRHFRGRP